MARAIRLTRLDIKNANHYHLRGFRLRVEVAEVSGGMDRNVFLYRRHPPDPRTGEIVDEFATVCSFPDLAEYPVGDPSTTTDLPFLRKDFVELDVRSTRDCELVWETIRSQACALAAALDRADVLQEVETVWCGIPPASDSSASSASA